MGIAGLMKKGSEEENCFLPLDRWGLGWERLERRKEARMTQSKVPRDIRLSNVTPVRTTILPTCPSSSSLMYWITAVYHNFLLLTAQAVSRTATTWPTAPTTTSWNRSKPSTFRSQKHIRYVKHSSKDPSC